MNKSGLFPPFHKSIAILPPPALLKHALFACKEGRRRACFHAPTHCQSQRKVMKSEGDSNLVGITYRPLFE